MTTDRPYRRAPGVDEARAEIARGGYVAHEDFKRELAERMNSMR